MQVANNHRGERRSFEVIEDFKSHLETQCWIFDFVAFSRRTRSSSTSRTMYWWISPQPILQVDLSTNMLFMSMPKVYAIWAGGSEEAAIRESNICEPSGCKEDKSPEQQQVKP